MGLIYGYDQGAISGAIRYIKQQYHLSTFLQEAVTSAVVAGMVIGALIADRIANALGRKRTMVVISVGCAVFAVCSGIPPSPRSFRLKTLADHAIDCRTPRAGC
jgi:MFS family permease